MPAPEDASALFESILRWDADAVAAALQRDQELWAAQLPGKGVSLNHRRDVAWMLGDVSPTPLSVAVRLARKDDKKKGAEMVKAMLQVLETQPSSYWKRPLFPPVTTPLHEAMFYGLAEIAVMLVKAGFRPDANNSRNFTAMDMAEDPSLGQKVRMWWKGTGSEIEIEDDAADSESGFQSSSSISRFERGTSATSMLSSAVDSESMRTDSHPELPRVEDEPPAGNEFALYLKVQESGFLGDEIDGMAAPEAFSADAEPSQALNEEIKVDIVSVTAVEPSQPAEADALEAPVAEVAITEPLIAKISEPMFEPQSTDASETELTAVRSETPKPDEAEPTSNVAASESRAPRESLDDGSRTPTRSNPNPASSRLASGSPDKGLALFERRQNAAASWSDSQPSGVVPIVTGEKPAPGSSASSSPTKDRGLSLFEARKKQIEEAESQASIEVPPEALTPTTSVAVALPVPPAASPTKASKLDGSPSKDVVRTASLIFSSKDTAPATTSPYTPTTSVARATVEDAPGIVRLTDKVAHLGQSQPDFVLPELSAAKDDNMRAKQDSKFDVEMQMPKSESGISLEAEDIWESAAQASQLPPRIPLKSTPSRKGIPKIDTSQRALREVAATNSSASGHSSVGKTPPASPYGDAPMPSPAASMRPGPPPNTPLDGAPSLSDFDLHVEELDQIIQNLPLSSSSPPSVANTPTSARFSLPPIGNVPPNTPITPAPSSSPGQSSVGQKGYNTPPNTPTVWPAGAHQPMENGFLTGILAALQSPDPPSPTKVPDTPASDASAATLPAPPPTLRSETTASSSGISEPAVQIPEIPSAGRLELDFDDVAFATSALFQLEQAFPEAAARPEPEADKVITYTAPNPELVKARIQMEKEELKREVESGAGWFAGRVVRCEIPKMMPDYLTPAQLWIGVGGTREDCVTERMQVDSLTEHYTLEIPAQNRAGFSLYIEEPEHAEVTLYLQPLLGRKAQPLSHHALASHQPSASPPPLPPRRDSNMHRQASVASFQPSLMSQTSSFFGRSFNHELSYGDLSSASGDVDSDSTALAMASRQSNASSASLAGSMRDPAQSAGVVAARVQLDIGEAFAGEPLRLGGHRVAMVGKISVEAPAPVEHAAEPASPQPHVPPRGMPSANDPGKRSGLLGRLGNIVGAGGRKPKPASPFARPSGASLAPPSAAKPPVPSRRHESVSMHCAVVVEGLWIPGRCESGPLNLADAEAWAERVCAADRQALDALAAGGEGVPEWVGRAARMRRLGVLP
ncbi:hypothetical protein DFJ74DRAFT_714695 [Hyaloraphidium curvatum]|nr:hypothetical protein DFJ74DRAFT_714695 [Hyaloraphidium curvatum]